MTRLLRRPSLLVWLSLASLLPVGGATGQPAPVRQVVPYSGHLDRDGAPFDGVAALRFRLYLEPVAGEPVWLEAHPAVNVRGGRFAVRLGEQPVPDDAPSIVDLAAGGQQLYLELAVGQAAAEGVEPEWTSLAGRQAIHPVPQAIWSATATDLPVARLHNPGGDPVTVDDDLAVTGALTVGEVRADGDAPLRVDGALAVTGEVIAPRAAVERLSVGDWGVEPDEGGDLIVAPSGEGAAALRVTTPARFVGRVTSNDDVYADDDLQAGDDLRVGDDADIDGTLSVGGRATVSNLTVNGGITLDGQVINRLSQSNGPGYEPDNGRSIDSGLRINQGLCFLTEVNISGDCRISSTGGANPTWRLESIGNSGCAMRCIRWRD